MGLHQRSLVLARLEVDHAPGLAVEEGAQVGLELRQGVVDIDVAEAAEMRRDDGVGCLPQRIVGRQRLVDEPIQPGTGNLSIVQRID